MSSPSQCVKGLLITTHLPTSRWSPSARGGCGRRKVGRPARHGRGWRGCWSTARSRRLRVSLRRRGGPRAPRLGEDRSADSWDDDVSAFTGRLGALAGAALPSLMLALAGTGSCGALTTYSAFSYETLRLASRRRTS